MVCLTVIAEGGLLAQGMALAIAQTTVVGPGSKLPKLDASVRRDGSVIPLVWNRRPGAQRGLPEPEGEPPWRRFHLDLAVSTDGRQTVQRILSVIQTPDVTPRASDRGSPLLAIRLE